METSNGKEHGVTVAFFTILENMANTNDTSDCDIENTDTIFANNEVTENETRLSETPAEESDVEMIQATNNEPVLLDNRHIRHYRGELEKNRMIKIETLFQITN